VIMVKVTVILCTKRREPQFKWALDSLKNQSYKDFEYIIVDGLYNSRKDNVAELIKNSGVNFPVTYLSDKPTRWKGRRPALCNGRNTGLMFAKGELIVFHDDCCQLYPDWLEKHVKWLEQGYLVAGNWIAFQDTDDSIKGITGGKGIVGVYGWEHRSKIVKEPKIVTAGWLYGGNFSFPLKVAIDINGFDERCDGEMGQDDIDFGFRAERKGYKVMYDPTCCLEYHYKKHGALMSCYSGDSMTSDFFLKPDSWRCGLPPGCPVEIDVVPVNLRLKDGLLHFSNEFLMQELLEDSCRYLPRGNNFNLANIRKIVVEKGYNIEEIHKILEGYIDPDLRDWRDSKLISEKLISEKLISEKLISEKLISDNTK
jgi:glycosyltransferase involved in cell wall biosynthesis